MSQNDSILISMIGPEERVLGFFIQDDRPKVDQYLFLINKEYSADPRIIEYRDAIEGKVSDASVLTIESSYDDSMEVVKEFNQCIVKNQIDLKPMQVYLDISTFNRQNLLIVLFLLRVKYQVAEITCYYTVPKDTNVDISKCAHGVNTVPFFGGKQSNDKNKLLILMVGFEYDRAVHLWEKLEPSKTLLIVGDEPTEEKFLNRNLEIVDKIKNRIDVEDADIRRFSARDPLKARDDIENVIREFSNDYNIIVSPMNTKIQTLGLYLAWENYPDVQIVYSRPDCFSDWLSKGIQRTVSFIIQ